MVLTEQEMIQEQEANKFALLLLMPSNEFQKALDIILVDIESETYYQFDDLCAYFGVTPGMLLGRFIIESKKNKS